MKKALFITINFFFLAGCISTSTIPTPINLTSTIVQSPVIATKIITASSTSIITTTPIVSPTIFPPNQFDVSSILTQTPSSTAQCPAQNNALVPDFADLFNKDTMYDTEIERNIEQPIVDFLNKGGSPKALIDTFNKEFDETKSKSFQQDITNDGVPELIVSDILLHIFGCQNGEYITLLKIIPSTIPYIQNSNLLFVQDMNLNGMPDLVISEWVAINLYVPDVYRIMEWDGKKFKDLIIQPEFVSRYGAGKAKDGYVSIDGVWSFVETPVKAVEVSDIDENGTLEFILRGGLPTHPDTRNHGPWRAETDIYMWNGEGFVIYSVEPAPPVYRFQAIQDADYAFFDEEYAKAVTLYQEVIFNDKLDWWSTEKWIHEIQVLDAMNSNIPVPTPLPPVDDEYYYLSAYAQYRIMLIYVKLSWLPEAEVIYKTLQQKYPVGKEGHVIAELAKVFWDEFLLSNNLSASCSKAVEFTALNIFEIFNYIGSVKTDKSYDWTYHGWQKAHNYIVDDICPFK